MPYKDKYKQYEAQHASYLRNKEKVAANNLRARKRKHAWLSEIKANIGCQHCAERTPCCLDFHHRNPTEKLADVSDMVRLSSKAAMEAEIAKCDVLCANCHRKEEYLKRCNGSCLARTKS